ncbi:hypothetical protein SNEBB_005302 [Seison nebaliae]|nr:hypothetical protein SNEBB_005302 [Seison nebaliae]
MEPEIPKFSCSRENVGKQKCFITGNCVFSCPCPPATKEALTDKGKHEWFQYYTTVKSNPIFHTTSNDYGLKKPTIHTMPTRFHSTPHVFFIITQPIPFLSEQIKKFLSFQAIWQPVGERASLHSERREKNLFQYNSGYSYRIVCYFANWAAKRRSTVGRLIPEDVDPFLCTHINFAFAKVSPTTLELIPFEADDTEGWNGGPGMYGRLIALRRKNIQLKIMLSVGGWTAASKGFNEACQSISNLKKFANNVVKYIRKYSFDGFDIDWEYPGAKDRGAAKGTREKYTEMVRILRETFNKDAAENGKNKILLTTATAAAEHRIEEGYEVEKICKYFDFINVMTYDYHGAWDGVTGHNSPLFGRPNENEKHLNWNINSSMFIWHELGCPRSKLNIGISTYGRTFQISKENLSKRFGTKARAAMAGEHTRESGVLAYFEICEKLKKPSMNIYWHRQHDISYAFDSQYGLWIGYDNIRSVENKMNYLKRNGFGGVIIWSLDLDDHTGTVCNEGKFPIISTIKQSLTNKFIDFDSFHLQKK